MAADGLPDPGVTIGFDNVADNPAPVSAAVSPALRVGSPAAKDDRWLDRPAAAVSPAEPPEYLSDVDGDVAFVRLDLGETPTLACEWALGQGVNLSQMEADPVEMLRVPEHFTDIEYEWAVVRGGTPGAVAYWRFRA